MLLVLGMVACKKPATNNFVPIESLAVGSYLRLESTGNTKLSYSTLTTDKISITASGVGEPIDKVISYVSTNGSLNKTTWKKITETTAVDNKVTISFTGAQLAAALNMAPSAFSPGTSYTIYNEIITKSGKVYSMINTASSFEAEAAYAMAMRFKISIVCPFVAAGFPGDFEVVLDEWADFNVGDIVKVTSATATSIAMEVYPAPAYGSDRQPIIVTIDPTNGAATVARQYYGKYGSTKVSAETFGSSNFVFACTGTITLVLKHTSTTSGGSYGTYALILKKK